MAVDHNAILLACRARALTLSVCTTGPITMSATASGYTRTVGSFDDDQLAVGMELVASGFAKSANNGARVITAISADGKSVAVPGCVAESAQSGRTLSVGFPSDLVRANIKYTRTPGKTFAKEQYIPGVPPKQVTLGANGELELMPMYSISFLVPDETGELAALRYVNAASTLFTPRTAMALSSGDVLRVRDDTGPYLSQLLPAESGFASMSITAPLWIRTRNPI